MGKKNLENGKRNSTNPICEGNIIDVQKKEIKQKQMINASRADVNEERAKI